MYYTYVLWSKQNKRFYIGFTSDLKRRMREHLSKKVYTTSRMEEPALIFYEGFKAKGDAQRRERYFKMTKGKKALRLILRCSLEES